MDRKGLAVVTGSTSGIGRAIALEFAKQGHNVVVNGRNEATVKAVADELDGLGEGKVLGVVGDVGSQEGAAKFTAEVDALVSHLDLEGVSVLVNNVGIFETADFFSIPDSRWQEYFEVNFFSCLRLSRHWLRGMLQRGRGRIISISSEAGVRIIPDMMHYSITKQMQTGLDHGLAQLTRGTAVTVNTVLPGPTMTEGVQTYLEGLAKQQGVSVEEATTRYFKQREPSSLIQRFIKPEEVAATVVFLASEGAAAINGAAIRCEGGLVMHV